MGGFVAAGEFAEVVADLLADAGRVACGGSGVGAAIATLGIRAGNDTDVRRLVTVAEKLLLDLLCLRHAAEQTYDCLRHIDLLECGLLLLREKFNTAVIGLAGVGGIGVSRLCRAEAFSGQTLAVNPLRLEIVGDRVGALIRK